MDLFQKMDAKAWEVVELLKEEERLASSGEASSYPDKFKQVLADRSKALSELYEIIQPTRFAENFSYTDILDLLNPFLLVAEIGKKAISEITFEEFQAFFRRRILQTEEEFQFYFRIGPTRDFPIGYLIGYAKLIPFENLPPEVKETIRAQFNYLFKFYNEGFTSLEDFKKARELEWYMEFDVKSIGANKASEKAVRKMKRSFGIYKMAYRESPFYVEGLYKLSSQFDYWFQIQAQKGVGSSSMGAPARLHPLVRIQSLDERIEELNQITNLPSPNKLEEKLMRVVDVFGMLEESTPLQINFMLATTGLEILVLGESDRGNLTSKLSERVAFLLGDSKVWLSRLYDIPGEKIDETITAEYVQSRLSDSRIRLESLVKTLYDKRSGFAHEGEGSEDERQIAPLDFHNLMMLLLLVFDVVLALRRERKIMDFDGAVSHALSLAQYINRIKYS